MSIDHEQKVENDTPKRLDRLKKEEILGLPAHAQIQKLKGEWYVFFAYCFRLDGKRYQERDYIGTISPDGREFRPNLYYVQHEPRFENRPVDRWRHPVMRERAQEKLRDRYEVEALQPGADLDVQPQPDQQLSVGATVLASAILEKTGMIEDLHKTLNGDLHDTVNCANLAIHAAITSDKTYQAEGESELQKFIGKGCPSSPRASEFFQKIGTDLTLSGKMARARAEHMKEGQLCALDGTRLNSDSKNISSSAIGQRKDKTFGSQINLSLLLNVDTGEPICYRYYGGNINDGSTLDDFRQLLSDIGISEKKPVILMDRGYPSYKEFIKLNAAGLHFLVGAKTSMKVVQKIIDERNSDFYLAETYMRNQQCHGVKETSIISDGGEKMTIQSYIFRSPMKQAIEMDAMLNEIDEYQKNWAHKKRLTKADDRMLKFFVEPTIGQPLVVNKDTLYYEFYARGFFGFVGNIDTTLPGALSTYRRRNEVEVAFKQLIQGLISSTRVHSSAAFDGLMMTTFVALSVLTYLRSKLGERIENERAKDPLKGSMIGDLWTIQELLRNLRRIKLTYSKAGTPRLLGVTKKDKDLATALGFPGLFDSADHVAELLSAKHLAQRLNSK